MTACPNCNFMHCNFKRPRHCKCGYDFGHGFEATKTISSNEAFKLNKDIYSIRRNPKGPGKRTFVHVQKQNCYADACVENKTILTVPCIHIEQCLKTDLKAKEYIWKNTEESLKTAGFSAVHADKNLSRDKGNTTIFKIEGISGPSVSIDNTYKDA